MADGTATPSAVALAVSFANRATAPPAEHLWDVSTYADDGSPLLDTGTIGGIDLPGFNCWTAVVDGAIESNASRNGTSPTPVPVTDWSMLWVGELAVDGFPMINLVSENSTAAGVSAGNVGVAVAHTDGSNVNAYTGEPPLKLAVTWMALVRAGEILTLYREGFDPFIADTTLGVSPLTGNGTFGLGFCNPGVIDKTVANLRGGALWESALTEPQLIDAASWFGAAHIAIGEDAHVDGDVSLDTIALVARVAGPSYGFTETFTGTNGDPWDPTIWDVNPLGAGAGSTVDIQNNKGRMYVDNPGYADAQVNFSVPALLHLDAYFEATIVDATVLNYVDVQIHRVGAGINAATGGVTPHVNNVIGTSPTLITMSFADGDTVKIRITQIGINVEVFVWITGSQPGSPTFAWTQPIHDTTIDVNGTSLYVGSNDGTPGTVFWDNISISSYDLLAVVTGENNGGGGGGTSEGGMPFFTNRRHGRPSHRVR